jgi:hypothetical protein
VSYETAIEANARRAVEKEFARAFEEQHGLQLLGPEQIAGETRELPATPFVDRRLELEVSGLAELVGLSREELL